MLTFEEIRKNPEIKTYIERSNEVLGAVGFTEHGFPHALRTSDIASRILRELGYDARTCELAQIAGYMHDIGNLVNRHYHAQNGACLAFQILSRLRRMKRRRLSPRSATMMRKRPPQSARLPRR